jgi:hypothetical protein
MTYRCPACGWSKTVRPRSDALMPGDYFDRRPNCSHAELELYGVEQRVADLDSEARLRIRQAEARPLADALLAWLKAQRLLPPSPRPSITA